MRIRETHPSYATISISRRTGCSGMNLFASSIPHDNAIAIRISHASVERNLSSDWIFDDDRIIEVFMSPIQFAELLTSQIASGVPCTIASHMNQAVPPPPMVDRKAQFSEEVRVKLKGLLDAIREVRDQSDQHAEKPNKKNFREVSHGLDKVITEITSNLPFIQKMFEEQMEETIGEAKAEIEAHLLHRALVFAQDGLKLVEESPKPMNSLGEQ